MSTTAKDDIKFLEILRHASLEELLVIERNHDHKNALKWKQIAIQRAIRAIRDGFGRLEIAFESKQSVSSDSLCQQFRHHLVNQMNVKELLIAARAVIIDPKNWCQFLPATDKRGNIVHPKSTEATCWCSYGVIGSIPNTTFNMRQAAIESLKKAAKKLFKTTIVTNVNDKLGYKAVIQMFDQAIKAA